MYDKQRQTVSTKETDIPGLKQHFLCISTWGNIFECIDYEEKKNKNIKFAYKIIVFYIKQKEIMDNRKNSSTWKKNSFLDHQYL